MRRHQDEYNDLLHRASDDMELYGVVPDDIRCKPQLDGVNLPLDNHLPTGFEFSYDSPVYFDNLDKHTPDLEFDEVGCAENIDTHDENLKERENLVKEVEVRFGQLGKEGNYDPSYSHASVRSLRNT